MLPIAKEEVELWKEGDALTVILVVLVLDKSGTRKTFKSAPLVLTLNEVSDVVYENFDKQKVALPQLIKIGGVIDTPTMTITQLSGSRPCGIAVFADVPGFTQGAVFAMNNGPNIGIAFAQRVRMNLKQTCSKIQLSVALLNSSLIITFYDALGKVVGDRTLIGTLALETQQRVDFASPNGRDIARIELYLPAIDLVVFDSFALFP